MKRTIMRVNQDGSKTQIEMKDVKKNDVIILKEDDGEMVGGGYWRAYKDAQYDSDIDQYTVVADVLADDERAKIPALLHE